MTPDSLPTERSGAMAHLPAIRTVLAAYRSTTTRITEEQITAAWTEYEETKTDEAARLRDGIRTILDEKPKTDGGVTYAVPWRTRLMDLLVGLPDENDEP